MSRTVCQLYYWHTSYFIFPYQGLQQQYNKQIIMQSAINLTDTPRTEYNGWSDWTTWNCALWIGGDEGLYNEARHSTTYGEFVETMHEYGLTKTPDGAVWAEADFTEMQECLEDL